jgi:DNA-binding MarR family transcriptional regulator
MSRESKEDLLHDLVNQVRRAQNASALVDAVTSKVLGVSDSEGMCIDILDREGPVTAGRLAQATGLTTGAITAVIDRLEEKGYARRFRDERDRRRVLVEPTKAVLDKAHELYAELGQAGYPVLTAMTREQLETIRDFERFSADINEDHAARLRERYGS